jgi:ABC-2 type transport system permease protein
MTTGDLDVAWRRTVALFLKELRQIRRSRQLLIALLVPPTVQVLLFGLAQNPDVKHLRLGVVDEAQTPASRELVQNITKNTDVFASTGQVADIAELNRMLERRMIEGGLIVPAEFSPLETPALQLLLDGSDPNRAGIAAEAAREILRRQVPVTRSSRDKGEVRIRPAFYYNPGLETSWFVVTGTVAILLLFNASIVTASSLMTEKDRGTLDQLLMTPLGPLEIMAGKIGPIVLVLSSNTVLALGIAMTVFGIPMRGSLLLLLASGVLCVSAGAGVGMLISTFSDSQPQAQLIAFFVNAPLALISGATTPVEAMPATLQTLSYLNPVRHYAVIIRAVMLKGAGVETLLHELTALTAFTVVVFAMSVWRFRR